ncbi:hypothetical protein CsSME_00005204 [Camellia sinensis var. sinensis]
MKEEYGLFVWPCSVVLAEYVWQQMSCFSGVSMIKLGAGTSLPGLVAAKVGLDVTLTAESNRPEVTRFSGIKMGNESLWFFFFLNFFFKISICFVFFIGLL